MVHINGVMVDITQETGKTIKWKDQAFTLGKMVENMKANINKTKRTVEVFKRGLMGGNMMENGKMDGFMEEANIHQRMVLLKMLYGITEKFKN